MSHIDTHPNVQVPDLVKDHFPIDTSWHHDECPSFQNIDRSEAIYWAGSESTPSWFIFAIDRNGIITGDRELAMGSCVAELREYLNSD